MMDELVAIRAQKAEILKKEKDTIRAIQERAVRQSDRIKSMGISVPPAPTIDQIGTRANDKPADEAILHEILVCRGEVLEPALLERLRKLAKAATPRMEIEVTPRAGAPEVVDLLIKVVGEEK